VAAAVGAAAGEAVLYAAGSNEMSRLGSPNAEIADPITPLTVPIVTLDDYCTANGVEPDWLLIDVEGFEIAALLGARRLIKRRGKALEIVVELHPREWGLAGTTRADLEALLADLGRVPIPLHGQAAPLEQNGLVYLAHR
jgi:hypothetical protein